MSDRSLVQQEQVQSAARDEVLLIARTRATGQSLLAGVLPMHAGDELAVEQQQRSGDADRGLGVAVVKQPADLCEAGGVIDGRVGRAGRRARDVQRRDDPGRVRPGQERAGWQCAARRAVQPIVDVGLSGLLEREVVVVKPAGEAARDTQVGVVAAVAARAGSSGPQLPGVVGPDLPSGVGRDVCPVGMVRGAALME